MVHVYFYKDIISLENLFTAWREFLKGKRKRGDVAIFSEYLSENIYNLHLELRGQTYRHGGYKAFNISDPKPRNIHKASVRDRLLHHAIYRKLYPYFDKKFIYDSYSCRIGKGTHKAMDRFKSFFHKESKNNTKTCYVLKCDIKKFFASINHETLLAILASYRLDQDTLCLLKQVIKSFNSGKEGQGLPLGNLTSQLLVNIYMNEFDQFIKHNLKIKYYIRYADDFVILSGDKTYLKTLIPEIKYFLENKLKLALHPNKVSIETFSSGIDFLGWIHFSDHRVLRTTTKRRMLKRLKEYNTPETVASYVGLLKHGNAHKLQKKYFGYLTHESFSVCFRSIRSTHLAGEAG
jgi:retron-type reverse transcriptase